ncbi:MAG TPA: thioredoxin domain-containing protein [Steroidobacteraceae bacterium]|nr:thioredoxin domain-containing protein [Steroidobacteraceae bacterium]
MKSLLPALAALLVLASCSRSEPDLSTQPSPTSESTGPAAAPVKPAEQPVLPADLHEHLVRADSPVLGSATAPVTIVEFLDPACEGCRAFAPVVRQIQFLYPDDVRVVVRLADFHPGSEEAIRILLAAQRQHRFEEVLTALFDRQEEWASHHSPDVDAAWQIAAAAGLDVKAARSVAESSEITGRLREEGEDIMALKVARTPTFYVNGKLLEDFGAEQLMSLVKTEVEAGKTGS